MWRRVLASTGGDGKIVTAPQASKI